MKYLVKRISKATILVLGKISEGENFDNNKLNNSLKIFMKQISDIKLSLSDGLLTINLVENPIIENIEITGIKSKPFQEKIFESIVLKERMSFSEDQLQKDINLIRNILKTNGFYFAILNHHL